MARKPVIEYIKMLCTSNKKEIIEIKFSSANVLKMVITWADTMNWFLNSMLD